MPLDHDLPPIADHQCLLEQSKDLYRSAHRAASVEHVLCPAENYLLACVYIALRCSRCGELRQAIGELPQSENVACPECGRICSFIRLGSGLTKKALPFHEIHTGEQMPWDRWSTEKNDSS